MFRSNTRYRIKTPLGFEHFKGVQKKQVDTLFTFVFTDGTSIKCSGGHSFLTAAGFQQARNIRQGDSVSGKTVSCITQENGLFDVYDPVGIESATYLSEGLVSHNTEFIGSSKTLISGAKLRTLTYHEPIEFDESIRVYEKPVPGHIYLCTVDTSRGLGLDYSAFKIYDITTVPYKTVMVFRNNNIAPYILPDYIYRFAQSYNEAMVLVEINDLGQQVVDILYKELEYVNVLSTAALKAGHMTISGGFGSSATLGIRTTKQTKRVGCASLKSLVEGEKLIINDYNTIYELQRFVSNEKDSYEAEEGCNDDLVMCDVLMAWAMQQPYMKDLTNHDIRKSIIEDNAKVMEDQLTPFGFIFDGQEENKGEEVVAVYEDPGIDRVDRWLW